MNEQQRAELGLQFHIDEGVGALDIGVTGWSLSTVHSAAAQRPSGGLRTTAPGTSGRVATGGNPMATKWAIFWISFLLIAFFIGGLFATGKW